MGTISRPWSPSGGDTIVASDYLDNLDTIYNEFNGNIENANIKAGAAIALNKLSLADDVTFTGDVSFTNTATTDNVFKITGSSLTSGRLAHFYSNSADTSARSLVEITNDNAAADGARCLVIDQDGDDEALRILADTTTGNIIKLTASPLTTGFMFHCNDADALTTGGFFVLESDSSDTSARKLVEIINQHADADAAECLFLHQDGADHAINTNCGAGTPAHLTQSGTWTNASSCHTDKIGVKEIQPTGYAIKLKKLKLFEYQAKAEVYGNPDRILKEDGTEELKFRKTKKFPNARKYKGYILDDASTPAELVARNTQTGEIDGVSPADGVNFLLGVCKELIKRVEVLESA